MPSRWIRWKLRSPWKQSQRQKLQRHQSHRCSTCSTDRQILSILCMQSLSQSYQIASNKFKRFKNETKCQKDIFISFLYHQEWLLENCFTRSFPLRQIRRRLAVQSPGFGRGTQWLWFAHADCMKLRLIADETYNDDNNSNVETSYNGVEQMKHPTTTMSSKRGSAPKASLVGDFLRICMADHIKSRLDFRYISEINQDITTISTMFSRQNSGVIARAAREAAAATPVLEDPYWVS